MQTTPTVYRFSGLISILGLLALLVGLIVMILLPGIRPAAWAVLLLGILLLASAFIIEFRRVRSALTGRRGRFGTGTTVMVSIFIGITLLVNAISISNYQRFDVTALAQFTLTPQTQDALSKLETPVQALCFFVPADPYGLNNYADNLLTEYQNYTDQLSIERIDPDEHPDQARQYGIIIYPTVVFESQYGRRLVLPQEIVAQAEHAFTSAILEVTGIVQKKVYFLTGHGETDINSTASNGYSRARDGLLDNLFKVETLDLTFTPSIPEDCTALIIVAPQMSLTSSEVEVIERYLENDGWVMVLTNPDSPLEIKQLLSSWDVEIEEGTVIDPSSYVVPSMDSPIVPRIRNFFGLSETYFPGATAITPQPGYIPVPLTEGGILLQIAWMSEDTDIVMYSLVRTSQDSWLEKDFNPNEDPELDEGIDLEGPLNIGFLITTIPTEEAEAASPFITTAPTDEAEEEEPEEYEGTRLVVIGDSDFASNQHFYNGNNSDLFLNAVNLLTAGKELISIERKVLPFRRLVIGPEATSVINYSSIGLLPLLVLVIGGILWWRRR